MRAAKLEMSNLMNFGAFAVAGAVAASTGINDLWACEQGLSKEKLHTKATRVARRISAKPFVFPLCSSCAAFLCTIPVMRIALGADHAGFELKQKIKAHLEQQGIKVADEGTATTESVDYPDFAKKVGEAVAHKQADLGVLVCGSGIGMAIAANKVSGIRAANVSTE